ncbi:11133_t:CDS:2, partial [Dentiscutata heterogama]
MPLQAQPLNLNLMEEAITKLTEVVNNIMNQNNLPNQNNNRQPNTNSQNAKTQEAIQTLLNLLNPTSPENEAQNFLNIHEEAPYTGLQPGLELTMKGHVKLLKKKKIRLSPQLKHSPLQESCTPRITKSEKASKFEEEETKSKYKEEKPEDQIFSYFEEDESLTLGLSLFSEPVEFDFVSLENWGAHIAWWNLNSNDEYLEEDISDFNIDKPDKDHDFFFKDIEEPSFKLDINLGHTCLVIHKIHTGDAASIRQKPYRTASREREFLEEEIGRMLEESVIQPSDSLWVSPIVLIKQK